MFKQRKNKTFNYQPKFSKENKQDSSKDFVSKWRQRSGNQIRIKGVLPVKTLILILVLLLLSMYWLENKYL